MIMKRKKKKKEERGGKDKSAYCESIRGHPNRGIRGLNIIHHIHIHVHIYTHVHIHVHVGIKI